MNHRACLAFVTLIAGGVSAAAPAHADPPACPASLGGYRATVQGSSVIVCPTEMPAPGVGVATCPYALGMDRVDVAGDLHFGLNGPCVPDPAIDAGPDSATPCYLDPCVPPGTYEYGYVIPPFAGCINGGCLGPTSGQLAVIVTVDGGSSATCDAGSGSAFGSWPPFDASVEDGALVWSGTCEWVLPERDGGSCAWGVIDGSVQWAPCPDGGLLCEGYTADGAAVPVECPAIDGGAGVGYADAGLATPGDATVPDGSVGEGLDASLLDAAPDSGTGGGGSSGGGGCGCSTAPGSAVPCFAPLAGLMLALGVRRRRSRARLHGRQRGCPSGNHATDKSRCAKIEKSIS